MKLVTIAIAATLIVGMCILSGCNKEMKIDEADILSQKIIPSDREPITVLVKHAFAINTFEAEVEKKFPDVDLVQVGNYTRNMGTEEYSSRLEHNDIPDIVMTWPLEVGAEYWAERLMDLSGYDFTSKYNLSMLDGISKDGKLYYLPGPSQVRGIVYNKTLFEEKGWQVPANFDEFVKLCKTIEDSGIRALQLGLQNSEVLDTAFVGYGYADCFSQMQDTKWIKNYNEGTGSFLEHFEPGLNTFKTLIDNNILKKSDLDVEYSAREQMVFSRKCAMIEDSVLMARQGADLAGSTDEFALMPFFNPGDGQDWARLYMVCYIGLSKELEKSENKTKLDTVMQLMEYISTLEGQEALMGDTGAMYSSLVGVSPPDVPETKELVNALKKGRYAIFPQLKNAQQALRAGLAGMVRGEMTMQDVANMVDAQNVSPPKKEAPRVLGNATTDFTLKETGNFVADCLREETDCDVALFLDNGKDGKGNSKGISAKIYSGDVTTIDIERILPDLKYGDPGTLWTAKITGKDLLSALEHTITIDNDRGGWFYYFSGLEMEYDVTAKPGERIGSISTADGKEIDPKKKYSVATMSYSVAEKYLQSCEKTDITITEIVEQAIEKKKNISPAGDDRFLTGK